MICGLMRVGICACDIYIYIIWWQRCFTWFGLFGLSVRCIVANRWNFQNDWLSITANHHCIINWSNRNASYWMVLCSIRRMYQSTTSVSWFFMISSVMWILMYGFHVRHNDPHFQRSFPWYMCTYAKIPWWLNAQGSKCIMLQIIVSSIIW